MASHDDEKLPRAASIQPGVCTCCGSVVLRLLDKDGNAFAFASIDPHIWVNLCNEVQDALETWLLSRTQPPAGMQ